MIVRRSILLTLCVLLFLTTLGLGQNAAETEKQITEFEVNGMKVLLKRRPGAPSVAAGLFIKGGTRELTAKEGGIENLMLSAATEGSRSFPRAVLRRELASTASVIGSDSIYDYSALTFTSTLEHFDKTWRIFTDIATSPAFDTKDVELTRSRITSLIQSREDSPDAALQMLVDRTLLKGTTYGGAPEGTLDSLRSFTRADLITYHKKVMVASRLLLVIVGDIDAEKIKALATTSFGKLPRGKFTGPAVPKLDFSRGTLDVSSRNLQTNYINGIFSAPSLDEPDYPAMRVAISILGSRVFEEVRVKRNLSYAPDANLGALAANTGAIYVTAVDANQAVSVMLAEISRLQTEPVSENEIDGVAALFLTNYFLGQETSAAQVRGLAQYELIGGGWRRSLAFLDRIRAVTPSDVQSVSKKYIRNIRFVVVGDPAKIDRSIFVPAS